MSEPEHILSICWAAAERLEAETLTEQDRLSALRLAWKLAAISKRA